MLLVAENFYNCEEGSSGLLPSGITVSSRKPGIVANGYGVNNSKGFRFYRVNEFTGCWGTVNIPIRPSKRVVVGFWLKSNGFGTTKHNGTRDLLRNHIVFRNKNGDNLFQIHTNNMTAKKYADPLMQLKFHLIIPEPDADWDTISHNDTYDLINSVGIPIVYNKQWYFFEIYYDFQNVDSDNGTVKVAINGVEYVNLNGLVNANRHLWSSPVEDAAYCTEVIIGENSSADWDAYHIGSYIDSLYVCNEEMGYHDDFLGPVDINTLMPVTDGDQTNWLPYQDSEETPEAANFESLQNETFDSDGSYDNYVEAISHGERDLFYYLPGFDTRFIDLKAVIHNIAYKNTYTTNDLDLLKAIVPISKASGNDIVQEKPYITQVNEFVYNLLQVPYSIFPNLATPWTWELLENGQFGYEFRTKLWTFIQDEQLSISEELIKEHLRLHYPEEDINFTEDVTAEVNL